MNNKLAHIISKGAAPLLLLTTFNLHLSILAQGTAFTYQGKLNDGGSPAQGIYDFRFKLFQDSFGNTQTGGAVLMNGFSVTNGLFTATIDFGAGIFNGSNYWLEVDVRTNGGGSYANLNPLQAVTPSPYAIFANTASNVSGTISSANLSGTYGGAVSFNNSGNNFNGSYNGNGSNVTNVNAAALGGLNANQFWKTTGNSNTVAGVNHLGTVDNQPLELSVNGQRVLRLEPTTNSPNLIGGFSGNYVTNGATGAVIGGGGATTVFGQSGLNRIMDDFGVVSGGADNRAGNTNADPTDAYYATVGGGVHNAAEGVATFIGGGAENRATNNNSTIAGGYQNMASGYISTISGGAGNTNNGYISTIGGGRLNFIGIQADQSTIGGGTGNRIVGSELNAVASMIGGGFFNIIQTNVSYSTIAGGAINTIQEGSYEAAISGGYLNVILTNAPYSAIGGGYSNYAGGLSATIPGGYQSEARGAYGFAAGRRAKANHDGAFVWADSLDADFASTATNQFNVRANGGVSFVTGGTGMTLDDQAVATVNALTNLNAANITIGSLADARLSANVALRAGGNAFTGQQTISGNVGIGTLSPGRLLQVGDSAVASSEGMIHLGSRSVSGNSLRDWELGVPQTGDFVTGEGYSFVVRDTTASANARFIIKWGTGNVGIGTSSPAEKLHVIGNILATGSICANGGVNCVSDRNAKENFAPVQAREVLEKVAALPLSSWNYKADTSTRHLGPMAQDFHASFGLNGTDDKHIATVDEEGVALAAIQGLNEKVEEQRTELHQKQAEISDLRHELEKLKQVVDKLANVKDSITDAQRVHGLSSP